MKRKLLRIGLRVAAAFAVKKALQTFDRRQEQKKIDSEVQAKLAGSPTTAA